MIRFTKSQIDTTRDTIRWALARNGIFDISVSDLIPNGLSYTEQNVRANMFLCIGIGNSGQTLLIKDIHTFIRNGANRFFLSVKHRRYLPLEELAKNHYTGKYNVSCDFYVASTVFGTERLSMEIIREWNKMLSCVETNKGRGVRFVAHENDGMYEAKYILEDCGHVRRKSSRSVPPSDTAEAEPTEPTEKAE